MIYLEITKTDDSRQVRELRPGLYTIGADRDNQIVLAGPKVAGRHAIMNLRPGSCWIEDLTKIGRAHV